MATIVAAAGGGNWTTGGSWVGGIAPTAADDAQLNASSGNVVIDTGAVARSIDCTGYTGTLSGSATLTLGDATAGLSNIVFKLVSGMTYSATSTISIVSSSTTQQTITTAGKTIGPLSIPNFSTAPNLLMTDNLTSSGAITQNGSTFNTGGFSVQCTAWTGAGANARTITITNSTITLTGTSGTVWDPSTNTTLNASGSTIIIGTTSSSSRIFQGRGYTYGTLTYTLSGSTGLLTFGGSNTWSQINYSDASNARTITFASGTTQTLTSSTGFNINGTPGKLITLNSNTGGSAMTISCASGTVTGNYLSIQDSTVSGGATFNAINSTNTSGNTGWNFISTIFGKKSKNISIKNLQNLL